MPAPRSLIVILTKFPGWSDISWCRFLLLHDNVLHRDRDGARLHHGLRRVIENIRDNLPDLELVDIDLPQVIVDQDLVFARVYPASTEATVDLTVSEQSTTLRSGFPPRAKVERRRVRSTAFIDACSASFRYSIMLPSAGSASILAREMFPRTAREGVVVVMRYAAGKNARSLPSSAP